MANEAQRAKDVLEAVFDKNVAPPKVVAFAEEYAELVGLGSSDQDILIEFLARLLRQFENQIEFNATARAKHDARTAIANEVARSKTDRIP